MQKGRIGENCNYTLNDDGILIISGTGEVNRIPEELKMLIKEVVFEDGITVIGYSSLFECVNLKLVTIPDSVVIISDNAFRYCEKLENVVIPNSVKYIGDYAFSQCDSLCKIVIPDNVTHIGQSAFFGKNLKEIVVKENNEYYKSIDGVLFNKDETELITFPPKNDVEYTIPESVATICSCAFSGCISLSAVTIPSNVTKIGDSAFYCCESLKEIQFPDGIECIDAAVLAGCSKLRRFTVPNSVKHIKNEAFFGCACLEELLIPDNVVSIGSWAFGDCDRLMILCKKSSIAHKYVEEEGIPFTIVPSVKSKQDEFKINKRAEMQNGVIGNGCTYLLETDGEMIISGTGTVSELSSDLKNLIKEVVIRQYVTSIEDNAFSLCQDLTDVDISDTVESISGYAFNKCRNLCNIKVHRCSLDYCDVDGVLFNREMTKLIAYPGGRYTTYEIPESIISIEDGAFSGCILKGIVLPDGLTRIGDSVFSDCMNLTEVMIPDSVTDIGYSAFCNCINLAALEIPKNVNFIGEYAFKDCKCLYIVVIENDNTVISNNAFAGCEYLVIKCNENSKAHEYAVKHNIPFIFINDEARIIHKPETNIIMESNEKANNKTQKILAFD